MRHLRGVTLIEVTLLTGRMADPAGLGPLVCAARRSERIAARRLGAVVVAIPVSVVTVGAQEEHLAASPADHEP